MGRKLERAIAILNGTVGDFLVRSGNGLATQMSFARQGSPISVEDAAPNSASRIVVFVHGLMNEESEWSFADHSGDYGTRLERDLGFSPVYLRYNTGLPISVNGASLSTLLSSLVKAHGPHLEELLLIGHSMGGLVIRSACHVATVQHHPWLPLVRKVIYVGTPHRGAPMERAGKLLASLLQQFDDPYVQLVAQVGELRSQGIKDLGDPQHPVPLLPSIQHYLIAGCLSPEPWLALLFGDGVVPLSSATDGLCVRPGSSSLPPSHVRIFDRLGHMELSHHPQVYEAIRQFCGEETSR